MTVDVEHSSPLDSVRNDLDLDATHPRPDDRPFSAERHELSRVTLRAVTDRDELKRVVRRTGGRVVRSVRRRRSDLTPATLDSGDDPRLLFRPAADTWYVSHGDRWYQPLSDEDLETLIGLVPLEVLDDRHLDVAGSVGGTVRVIDPNGVPTLEFQTSVGEIIRRGINRAPGIRAAANWQTGFHDDGWVESRATIRLDGVRRCTLLAYLPELDGGADKQLAISVVRGRRTVVETHPLRRGEQNRIELYRDRSKARDLIVTVYTSTPEPADDERPLGFVAAGIEALA